MCCLVKCSVVTRKPPASPQAKGASSDILPLNQPLTQQQQCDKRLSLSDKLDLNKDTNQAHQFGKLYENNTCPMPSCSYQVDKNATSPTSASSSSSSVVLKSYFSNKYSLTQSCPQSAPASSQTSPSHCVSYKLFSSKLPLAIGLQPTSSSSLRHLPSKGATKRVENEDHETAQKEAKTRHHSVGDTFDNDVSPKRSPRLSGKSSPGKVQVKRSRRHSIASDVTSTSYPEGGFRYMSGFSSLTRPKISARDGKSASTGEPSPPPGRAEQKSKGSPRRSSRDKSAQL